jgi:uncharacterized protein YndB with AHSA1/START domain
MKMAVSRNEQSIPGATQGFVGKEVTFTRTFDAPRELVFACWTDPKHLAAWWGPHQFSNPRCEADARPGGAIHIDMRAPDGTVYPMAGRFEEVVPHERIVFTAFPLDARGNPMFSTLNTISLTEKGGKTIQVVTARVLDATAAAAPHLQGMEEGWKQSLERLETHLRGVAAPSHASARKGA